MTTLNPMLRYGAESPLGRRDNISELPSRYRAFGNRLGCLFLLAASLSTSLADGSPPRLEYQVAQNVVAAEANLPREIRLPFGWAAFPVTQAVPAQLRWSNNSEPADGAVARLRITVAVDDRNLRYFEVHLAESGVRLGGFDMRFPLALQLFELELPRDLALAAYKQGIALHLRDEGSPVWLLAPPTAQGTVRSATQVQVTSCPAEFQPHLLFVPASADPREEFKRRFASIASVAPFGWNEGCVLEGLRDLGLGDPHSPFEIARRRHWALFTNAQGQLDYENPRAGIVLDSFDGIESILPMADMALHEPDHPVVAAGVRFLGETRRVAGVLQGGSTLSAEGSYTMGYPLAVLAAVRHDRVQAEDSRWQFLGRRDRLWHDGAFWLRHRDSGQRTFRNWARGITWHFLGMVRALPYLRQSGVETAEIESEIRRIARLARQHQRPDGLWNCFIDDEHGFPDASGSAGIAAGLAIGARLQVLGPEDLAAAEKSIAALETKLTPDGFISGVAQGNRGGEALQRSDYRVLSNMGMGLFAQALAALSWEPTDEPKESPRVP